jgi:hypothetical protein
VSDDARAFFADGRDVSLLVDRLNADPEIAFIVPDGPLLGPGMVLAFVRHRSSEPGTVFEVEAGGQCQLAVLTAVPFRK